jgi:hypothetical protein
LDAVRCDLDVQAALLLRQRLEAAIRELEAAESRAVKLDREASAHAAFATELSETLHCCDHARSELAGALQAQRREVERVQELLESLRAQAARDMEAADNIRTRLEAEKEDLAGARRALESELAESRQDLERKTAELLESRASHVRELQAWTERLDQERGLRVELEADKATMSAANQKLMARLEECRRDLESRTAEARQREADAARSEVQELKRRLEAQTQELTAIKDAPQAESEPPAVIAPISDPDPQPEVILQSYIEEPAAPPGPGEEPAFQEKWWSLQGVLPDLPERVYRIGAGTLGALVLVVLPAVLLWNYMTAPARDHAVASTHLSAMTWHGDMLWVADYSDESIQRMRLESGGLRLERRYPLPGCRITGLAVAGGYLYAADIAKNEIQRRRLDDALTLDKAWPVASHNLSALAYSDGNLYAAFSNPGRIYKYGTDDDLTVESTYFSPPSVVGMAVDHGELWTADADSRLILRHRLDSSLTIVSAYGLKAPEAGGLAWSCFAMRGRSFWLGSDGQARIRQRPWRRFLSVPAPDFSSPAPEQSGAPTK